MKLLLNISGIVLSMAVVMAFISPEKKIDKLVSKVWKNISVEVVSMEVPDSLKLDVITLSEVTSEGETIGYVCYAMAFGCQVGGCAAPSTPNSQTFETFDYIVIYDVDLNIMKVDIAEYTGQYGYEICRQKWLAQFKGSTNGFVLNENVDGISGATVSAKYLIDDLNEIGSKMKKVDLTRLTASVASN